MNWIEVWYSVPWRKRERKISKDNGKKGKEEERKIIRKGKERKGKKREEKERKEKKWYGVEWCGVWEEVERRKICSENRITIKMKITSAHDERNSMKKNFDLSLPYENGS